VLEYIEGAFDQVRRERGSIGGYLRNRLGVSDPVAASIRTDPVSGPGALAAGLYFEEFIMGQL
jgi:hypothetical protein